MPNPAIYPDPGYNGQLVSLAGVLGASGKGRTIASYSYTLGSGIVLILSANPKRISAVLQNVDDPAAPGSLIDIYLGGVNTIPITLSPLGTLQIDQDLPWTGEVYANTTPNAPVILYNEVSIT